MFLVVRRRVKSSLDAFLASGERKIDRWFSEIVTVEVPASEFALSFRNINTEEERLTAEAELSR